VKAGLDGIYVSLGWSTLPGWTKKGTRSTKHYTTFARFIGTRAFTFALGLAALIAGFAATPPHCAFMDAISSKTLLVYG
jgi:hypothetical protein